MIQLSFLLLVWEVGQFYTPWLSRGGEANSLVSVFVPVSVLQVIHFDAGLSGREWLENQSRAGPGIDYMDFGNKRQDLLAYVCSVCSE
jgi:hypothetical protein